MSIDPFYPAVESVFALCFIVFVTLFFIPSKRKISEGKAGNLDSMTIPVFLGIGGVLIAANLVLILLGDYKDAVIQPVLFGFWFVLLMPVFIMTIWTYMTAKKLVKAEMEKGMYQHQTPWTAPAPPGPHPAQHHAANLPGIQHQHAHPEHAHAHPQHSHGHPPQHAPQIHAHPQHHAHAQPQAQTMTVECPQCGGHLHIPIGSNTITCPYCGLSGSM